MNLLENTDTLATDILRAGVIQKKLIILRDKHVRLRLDGRGRARGTEVREVSSVSPAHLATLGMVLCVKESEITKMGSGYKGGRCFQWVLAVGAQGEAATVPLRRVNDAVLF